MAIEKYREVYNRPEGVGSNPNSGTLWDSTGRSADAAGQGAYNAFMEIVGREPTEIELNQFLPVFQGSYEQGRGAVANFAQSEALKPENLQKKAPQYADQVKSTFQSMLGREATPEELNHFGGLLASGNVDSYQLQDFLKGTPEYQTQQDTQFRGGLANELQGYDQSFFGKAKEDVLNRFSDTGGLQNHSSALDFALTDLMGKIAENRGQYLANLSSQQYGGNKQLALNNYKGSMDNYLQDYNTQKQNSYNNMQGNFGRANEIGDYYRQMNDYNQSQQGQGSMPWGQLVGGLVGAGVGGFATKSPQGAQAGYNIGSGVGGGYDYYNRR